jgi:L-amino acid N-acyltransferase YncA
MIRHATKADYAAVVAMSRKFYDTLSYRDIPFCNESAVRWIELMRAQGCLLIVHLDEQIVGMAGALFSQCLFNDAYKVGSELFWWIEPEFRSWGIGRELLAELEKTAHASGCVRFAMASVTDHDRLGKIYGLAGYEETERAYSKRL